MKKAKLFGLLILICIIFIFSACTRPAVVENINTCFSDDDCVQRVFCGCNTTEYVNNRLEEANKAGIMFDACIHPPDSYCVCQNNECIQLIDKDARREKAEKFTINNSQIEDLPNLINYNQDEILNSNLDLTSDYIISWPITLNKSILTDKNIDKINLNLPQEINMILKRSEYSDDKWFGEIISEDPIFSQNDKIFFSTLNNRFLGTVMPYQIKVNNYTYIITCNRLTIK